MRMKINFSENYLLLAKAFGTPADVKKVEEILKRNETTSGDAYFTKQMTIGCNQET